MEKKEVIQKLGERKKMFEDYLELVRRQPRLQVNKEHPYGINTPGEAWASPCSHKKGCRFS